MTTLTKLLVGFLVLMGSAFILLNTATADEYLHQQEDYLNAIEDAKVGEWYEMTITCTPKS